MEIKFDEIIKLEYDEHTIIEHGIIYGNSRILLIKVGQNGDIRGYRDKYILLAKKMNLKYGVTVIVASNPFDGKNHLQTTFELIQALCRKKNIADYADCKVFYFGVSAGATMAALYGYKYNFSSVMLVNLPLLRNQMHILSGLEALCENKDTQKVFIVYGMLDASYIYSGILNSLIDKGMAELIEVDEANHNFKGKTEEFMSLPELLLK